MRERKMRKLRDADFAFYAEIFPCLSWKEVKVLSLYCNGWNRNKVASLTVTWLIASVAVYPLNGVGLIQLLKTWRFGMLWQVLTDSHVRHDIWFNGIKSLGLGLCGSGLLIRG